MIKGKAKVASASRSKTTERRPTVINEAKVANYLLRLKAALGDNKTFLPIFEAIKADPEIRQAEAVELATQFVARTAPSTTRAKALERVLKRHTSLASFKLKHEAMAGRSAA
jgi:hypothetical protein